MNCLYSEQKVKVLALLQDADVGHECVHTTPSTCVTLSQSHSLVCQLRWHVAFVLDVCSVASG